MFHVGVERRPSVPAAVNKQTPRPDGNVAGVAAAKLCEIQSAPNLWFTRHRGIIFFGATITDSAATSRAADLVHSNWVSSPTLAAAVTYRTREQRAIAVCAHRSSRRQER